MNIKTVNVNKLDLIKLNVLIVLKPEYIWILMLSKMNVRVYMNKACEHAYAASVECY